MPSLVLNKLSASINLENGTTATGEVKLVKLNMGDLSEAYFKENESAALTSISAIATALAPCLNKTVNSLGLTEYSSIVQS